MIQLLHFMENVLLLWSIALLVLGIFRNQIVFLIMSVGTLNVLYGVKCFLNDKLVLGIFLFLIGILIGKLCDDFFSYVNEVEKKNWKK